MRIDSFDIQNFRSFGDRKQLENLNDINVFVGPNGSGKSNIIRALYLIKGLDSNEYDSNVFKENVFDNKADDKISLELCMVTSPQERQGIFDRFHDISPTLNGLDPNGKFLGKLKYLMKLQGATIVEEKLSISNTYGEFIDLIHHVVDGAVYNQSSINLGETLPKIKSIENIDEVGMANNIATWTPSHSILNVLGGGLEYEIAIMVRSFFRNFHWYQATRSIDHRITKGDDNFIIRGLSFL
jgi:energy-coupling factor transporter ATP-binding protein EcfA2